MKLILLLLSTTLCLANPMIKEPVKCGLPAIKPDTSTSIVGGKDAIPYSWPWQVALFMPGIGQFCAGTLISPQWIVTAGHCFAGASSPSKYTVKLGVYNKKKNDEVGEQVLGISEIHVHPKYDGGKITYDITLLKLKTPVTFTDHISPVCFPAELQEELPEAGVNVFVTGWGNTKENGRDSDTLLQVAVPVQSTEKCKAAYPGKIYEDTQFCAGLDKGGKDSCQGDSGGPVVVQDAQGSWKQIGIVSWGRGCAEPKYFGVYSKLSAYVDFIKKYVTDL